MVDCSELFDCVAPARAPESCLEEPVDLAVVSEVNKLDSGSLVEKLEVKVEEVDESNADNSGV